MSTKSSRACLLLKKLNGLDWELPACSRTHTNRLYSRGESSPRDSVAADDRHGFCYEVDMR